MKFHLRSFIAITAFTGFFSAAPQAAVVRVADADGELMFDPASDQPFTARVGTFKIEPQKIWQLTLQKPGKPWLQGEAITVASTGQVFAVTSSVDQLTVKTETLRTDVGQIPVRVELTVTLEAGGVVGRIEVRNGSTDWIVRDVQFTAFSRARTSTAVDYALLWPNGLGQRFTSPVEFGRRVLPYPSGRGTMQWFALAGPDGGIYFGTHDAARSTKEFQCEWIDRTSFDLQVKHLAFCGPGGRFQSGPLVFRPYTGSWHSAAKIYRTWFDASIPVAKQPAWLKSTSGWLLAVLKQQNGEVLWNYSEIDRLCDLADREGLDTLGLYGWALGGHDKSFPEFTPDPLMGGRPELIGALARARARGKKIILYANGIMMDVTTRFYAEHGNEVAQLKENQELSLTSVRKFTSSTPVPFAMTCAGAEKWRQQLLQLAIQAQRLGANGILFDQLGTGGGGVCFAANHRHGKFGSAVSEDRFTMVSEIADKMKKIDPEFVIATEGMIDGLFESVGFFHGWGTGFNSARKASSGAADMFERGNDFPQLLRYTFPDWVGTIRHATPGLDAYNANQAVLLGLGLEIEGRYRPDKTYLEKGVTPSSADYDDVTYYPPDFSLLASLTPARASEIAERTAALRRRNASALMEGRFCDDEHIRLVGEGVAVAVFQARSGVRVVVLVNRTDQPRPFTLTTEFGPPTWAENIDERDVPVFAPLAANECRVLHFDSRSTATSPSHP